ncbi:hypothetical protein MBLNU459_g7700t2 [Dothideomycetes sp. NU459]
MAGPKKPSIVILEAREVCSGATGRNGGHVKVLTTTIQRLIKEVGLEAAEEYAAFVNNQIHALEDVIINEHIDCEFELRRSYDVFINTNEAEEATKLFQESLAAKQSWTRNVDLIDEKYAEQVTSIKGAKAALSMPACSLWPYKLVAGLLARLVDAKEVELHTWTPVTEISHENSEGDGSNFLHTSRGILKATKVVLATNAYTGGICKLYADEIVPVKGTACHISPSPTPVSPHLSHTYNIHYDHADPAVRVDYLNPRPDGGIVVGGAKWRFESAKDEYYGNWDDSTLLPDAEAHFDGLMQRHLAGWHDSGAKVDHLWTGIMGRTSDTMPHVGDVPGQEGKQYIIAGFNGGGNALIFLSAEGLAKMVLGQASFGETGLPKMFMASRDRLPKFD